MAVQCAKCGEELMGAVNRCWRCGQEFVARGGDSNLPPVRRLPVVSAAADVFVAELSEAAQGVPAGRAVAGAVGNQPPTGTTPTNKLRRGSPFADRGTATLESREADFSRRKPDGALEREARDRMNGGAAAGATLAVPLGFISLAAAFIFPLAGFPLALLGLLFGVWGLNSRRRVLAVVGLLLCCLSLAVATFNGSVEIYTRVYGVAPWESEASLL